MNKKTDMLSKLTNGIISEPMDIGTKQYQDFKLLIKSKVAATSKDERIKISLLGLKYSIEDYLKSDIELVKVGSFIKQFIRLVEIKQIDFANYLDIRPSNLSKLLSGERRLNVELALILEKLSDIDADLWLRIQNKNELRKMEHSHSKILKKYKLKELIR